MEESYLFVYGTLRKGFSLSIPETIAADIEWVGLSHVQGTLYDIGQYPGAVPDESGNSLIRGEVIKIKDLQKVFAFLDNYEGYDLEDLLSSEFRREQRSFLLDDGRTIDAWIYWYNFDVTDKKLIGENDYLKFLQKNQLA